MIPQRIGRYEILGRLGHGAMGEVFRARDTVLAREVAVKRVAATLEGNETARERFQREARSVARLSHTSIVTVYELGLEGDQPYMAMELLEGRSLKQALSRRELGLEETLDVVEQVLEGLAYAHARGVVHRDIKPANIYLLPAAGRAKAKILDFGLARLSGSDMTATGTVLGTPHYMSPEQVRGQKVDPRSDVFSLGCVLYEALSGRKPFDAESMHAVLYKVIQEEPAPLGVAAPQAPAEVVSLVEKALAKDPQQRFEDAGGMLAAFRRARLRSGSSEGRGLESAPTLVMTPGDEAKTGKTAAGASASEGVGAPGQARGSRRLLPLLVAGTVLLGVAGLWGLRTSVGRRAGPGTGSAPRAQDLTRAIVDTQLEVARRRLDIADFAEAARHANRALELDAENRTAREILDEARGALGAAEAAVARVRAAGSDRAALAAAAYQLMQAVPAHPEARRAAASAGAAFAERARQARRLARASRAAAQEAGAEGATLFGDGLGYERRGEQALEAGDAPLAAQLFLQSSRLFQRSTARR